MSFTSNEKSYGGYSSFSPMRNAESDKKELTDDQKYVSEKAEEIKEKQDIEVGQAMAIAWSILCKYKNPGSEHCKKNKSEYFQGRNKKAYKSKKEEMIARRTAKRIAATLDQLVSKALLHISKIIKSEAYDKREKDIIYYLWTHGKFPTKLVKIGFEARILGRIANDLNYEPKPDEITDLERKRAERVLEKILKYCHLKWSSKVWSKVWVRSGDIPLTTIRLEMLYNNIEYSHHYTKLIRHLFDE